MRYHPKSNKGVFSKKQRQASRKLMDTYRPQRSASMSKEKIARSDGMGFMAGLAALMGMRRKRG